MMNGCPRWSFLTVPLLAALGCSDPVPRPPQGNVRLSVQQQTGCPTSGKIYEVGNPDAPTSTDAGDRLIDGEHGASIKCSVKGSGPFDFSGTVKGTSGEHEPITVAITNGKINADKVTGTGTVNVYTPLLNGFSSAEGSCVFTVVGQQVKGGSVWATFSCPSVTQPPGKACTIGDTSTIVLENCDGS